MNRSSRLLVLFALFVLLSAILYFAGGYKLLIAHAEESYSPVYQERSDACRNWFINSIFGGTENRQVKFCGNARPVLACPVGTLPLFDSRGHLLTGKVVSNVGRIRIKSIDSVSLVSVRQLSIVFDRSVHIDSVILFDNDPKAGESGWWLNGMQLPVTGQKQWTMYQMNQDVTELNFSMGDDSSHWNACIPNQPVSQSSIALALFVTVLLSKTGEKIRMDGVRSIKQDKHAVIIHKMIADTLTIYRVPYARIDNVFLSESSAGGQFYHTDDSVWNRYLVDKED